MAAVVTSSCGITGASPLAQASETTTSDCECERKGELHNLSLTTVIAIATSPVADDIPEPPPGVAVDGIQPIVLSGQHQVGQWPSGVHTKPSPPVPWPVQFARAHL